MAAEIRTENDRILQSCSQAVRGCQCPILGGTQGQVGQGPGQADLMGADDLYSPFQLKPFYYSMLPLPHSKEPTFHAIQFCKAMWPNSVEGTAVAELLAAHLLL